MDGKLGITIKIRTLLSNIIGLSFLLRVSKLDSDKEWFNKKNYYPNNKKNRNNRISFKVK